VRGFDVSADDRRFLMIKDAATPQTSAAQSPGMVVVINFVEE
jgi:hypothetical protein